MWSAHGASLGTRARDLESDKNRRSPSMRDIACQPPARTASAASVWALLPLMVVVLVVFLVTGFAIPVLPLHVHQELGFGTFVVGLVTGSQFAASLISRVWSGHYADSRGGEHST